MMSAAAPPPMMGAQARPTPTMTPGQLLQRIAGTVGTPRGSANTPLSMHDWWSSIISGLGQPPEDFWQQARNSWPTAPDPSRTFFGRGM